MSGVDQITDQLGGIKLDDGPLTEAEITAIEAVNKILMEEPHNLKPEPKALVACTLIYKLKIERAVEAYVDLMKILTDFGVGDVFGNWEKEIPDSCFSDYYDSVGTDKAGRQIFWIPGKSGIKPDEETLMMRTATVFFLGMYGDLHSLRNGITMVIDQSHNTKKYGNEKKMQRSWMAFPNRPQAIYIFGASAIKRLFINGLLKFASLFTKNKVIDRVKFTTLDFVTEQCGKNNIPESYGGAQRPPTKEWIKQRLEQFPLPKSLQN
eukprot:m.259528 g.259528  ORF g.259528 m.259528 type:complete len:265 (-) comp38213_c0_seq1:360-1154(-)